ncbi:MAG: undecaprenyl-diphosphate phosphatase [Candidatus Omnitrophota bacterium]|jgi:undecaprenyl-diphosphatase|nr:MAG: undecaprenyl-diphosphate phosphatase [Candidatus Omnitrophota bacterium]
MLKFIILGVIQGVTEFLPVSSSGHLVILQHIFGVSEKELAIALILHLGTLLSLVVFFYKEIIGALRDRQKILLIIIVTAATGIIALSAKDFFESLFNDIKPVGISLFVTGIMLVLTKFINTGIKRDSISKKDSLLMGIVQGIAIIPGISRSGSTISALLFRGIDRKAAFSFSFLASIPAILGAFILEFKEVEFGIKGDALSMCAGLFFSFICGIASLWLLKRVLIKDKLHYFGYYCIILSIVVLMYIK